MGWIIVASPLLTRTHQREDAVPYTAGLDTAEFKADIAY